MAKQQKRPVVVAELGRPETSRETAARKAETSRLYKQRKTVNNLVFSLLVTLGIVALIVVLAPGLIGDRDALDDHAVDVHELATDAAPSAGRPLAAPEVPEAWLARQASLRGNSDITSWQINYTTVDETTDSKAYAAVVQAFTADGAPVNETWIAEQLEQQTPTGSERIGDIDWVVYDHTDRDPDSANMLFGLQGTWKGDTVLVYGTGSPADLRMLAGSVADSLASAKPLPGMDSTSDTPSEPSKES